MSRKGTLENVATTTFFSSLNYFENDPFLVSLDDKIQDSKRWVWHFFNHQNTKKQKPKSKVTGWPFPPEIVTSIRPRGQQHVDNLYCQIFKLQNKFRIILFFIEVTMILKIRIISLFDLISNCQQTSFSFWFSTTSDISGFKFFSLLLLLLLTFSKHLAPTVVWLIWPD